MELEKIFYASNPKDRDFLFLYKKTKKKYKSSTHIKKKYENLDIIPQIIIFNHLDFTHTKVFNKYKKKSILVYFSKYNHFFNNKFIDFNIYLKDDPKYINKSKNSFSLSNLNIEEDLNFFNLLKSLNWDTKFWGMKITTLLTPVLNKKIISIVNKIVKKNNIIFTSFLCDAYNINNTIIAQKNNFILTDIRNTYEIIYDSKKKYNVKKSNFKFTKASIRDYKKIQNFSDSLFSLSRYNFDNKFETNKVNKFYLNWILKSIKGRFDDCVYILTNLNIKNEILGFLSIKIIDNICQIGLIAINPKFSNKGIGSILIKNLKNIIFNRKKIKKIIVITQGRNIPAQRLYEKNNFLLTKSELWYHKWHNIK